MRSILLQLAIAAGALSIAAASIAGGDRLTVVAPPESVVENFTRAVIAGRFAPARQHLSRHAPKEPPLKVLRDDLHAAVGTVHGIDARTEQLDRNRSIATAAIEGDEGTATIRAELVFEDTEWRLITWSDIHD
jgi:hypothetical protein